MNPLSTAVLKSGLVSQDMLDELKRFGSPIELPEEVPPPPKDIEEAAQVLRDAIESEGYVLTRETDLAVFQQYLDTQRQGLLHVEVGEQSAELSVTYGVTHIGEVILPWRSESIREEMTNGLTHLVATPPSKIFFKDVRDLFFGEQKAFMVCTPSTIEPHELPALSESNGDAS